MLQQRFLGEPEAALGHGCLSWLQPLVLAFIVDIQDADHEPPLIDLLQVILMVIGQGERAYYLCVASLHQRSIACGIDADDCATISPQSTAARCRHWPIPRQATTVQRGKRCRGNLRRLSLEAGGVRKLEFSPDIGSDAKILGQLPDGGGQRLSNGPVTCPRVCALEADVLASVSDGPVGTAFQFRKCVPSYRHRNTNSWPRSRREGRSRRLRMPVSKIVHEYLALPVGGP